MIRNERHIICVSFGFVNRLKGRDVSAEGDFRFIGGLRRFNVIFEIGGDGHLICGQRNHLTKRRGYEPQRRPLWVLRMLLGREKRGGGEGREIKDDKGNHDGFAEISCEEGVVDGNNATSFGGDNSALKSGLGMGR